VAWKWLVEYMVGYGVLSKVGGGWVRAAAGECGKLATGKDG
jgi:hypothetical protein